MNRLYSALYRGVKAGAKTGVWMAKITVIITFAVAVLRWAGVLSILAEWLTPFFKFMGLSAEGVLVFITAACTNLYAVIALISTLGIDYRMATILAVMGLICHNMIVETTIQHKAGASIFYIVTLRVGMAFVAAVLLNLILPVDYTGTLLLNVTQTVAVDNSLGEVLYAWLISMLKLLPMMFAIILTLNMLQQVLREYRLIDYLSIPFKPLMYLFGLSKDISILWLIMNTIGLAYGGSILINEYQAGTVDETDARLLNSHVALSHSLVEDTLLFFAIGIGLFWLIIPRLILAIVTVWGERIYMSMKRRMREAI